MDALFRSKKPTARHDWTNTGSFINRPAHGWLHADEQLVPDAGICYSLRYIGSIDVLESMKSLDFDTRTAITKESISRICCAAGFKTANKKNKKGGKFDRYLGESPVLTHAGTDINLTITTESVTLISMDGGNLIAHHRMPTISFASGGDVDTLDYVAYVAKDETRRACHVVECGGTLAQDVITTLGQAFELRFKNYLAQRSLPTPITVPDRMDVARKEDYYNDSVIPPLETKQPIAAPRPPSPVYRSPTSNQPITNFHDQISPSHVDLNNQGAVGGFVQSSSPIPNRPATNKTDGNFSPTSSFQTNGAVATALNKQPSDPSRLLPYNEPWFHGKISRQKCDELLLHDGDFLVRESPNSTGQFVLSGRHSGHVSHLLLVDPNGQVRTKDQLFTSVSHLVNFHVIHNVPIMSSDCELVLVTPVTHDIDIM